MQTFFIRSKNMHDCLRFCAGAMALVLLGGCASGLPAQSSAPSGAAADSGAVAYVPLDDRPDNAERVEYLAESLGYRLDMPDEDLYKTCLDHQPVNANGTQYGDRAKLYEWVRAEEAAGCDRYILSLDQLLSGGLVNSRHMAQNEPVTLSSGETLSEDALLTSLLDLLRADPDNQVWLLDTVMRLAPTMGYAGFTLNGYNALRAYGMEARPTLGGSDLNVDQIVADYPLGSDGVLLSAGDSLKEETIQDYLGARARKLRLSDRLLSALAQPGYENFHVLIGIDDSAAEDSIQKNEITYLRQHLRSAADGTAEDWLLSGVDDLGFKAVTKLYLAESGWTGVTAQVRYFGDAQDSPACDYDYQPLTQIVSEHLSFFGLRQDAAGDVIELQILVLTQPKNAEKKTEYWQGLIDCLKQSEEAGLPTVLIDASNGAYGTAFHDALVKQCNLGWLLSYSGFLDMAIVTGTALANGVARYAWLQNGNGGDANANRAFLKTLAESIVKDFCYENTVREDLIAYVKDELNGSPDNFYDPPIERDAAQTVLEKDMQTSTRAVLKNFSHSNMIVSLSPLAEAGCGELSLSGYSFPWARAFEIRMKINVNDLSKIHKKFLFFYIS